MTSPRIRALRQLLDESTTVFGARFARSGRTVEDWEQARRQPDAFLMQALGALEARTQKRQAKKR